MIFTLSIVDPLFCREGKSNAHLNGDYQKIGDVMLNNMKVLQVSDVTLKSHGRKSDWAPLKLVVLALFRLHRMCRRVGKKIKTNLT